MKRLSALLPIVAGFSVMLLLMAAVAAIGVNHVRTLSRQVSAIVAERNQKSEMATSMRALHEARYQSLIFASCLEDPFQRDEEVMRFARMASEFIATRDHFLALPLDQEEHALWARVREQVRVVEETATQVIDQLQSDQLNEARHMTMAQVLPAQEHMMAEWNKLVEMQRARNRTALAETARASEYAENLVRLLSGGTIVAALLVAVFVIRLSSRLHKDLWEEKERNRVTLQAIGDAIIRFDHAHEISYLNPAAEELLGVTLISARSRPIAEVMQLFDRESRDDLTAPLVLKTFSGMRVDLPPTASLLSGSGLEYEIEGSCTPILDPRSNPMGGVLIVRDVTEAREMHRKILWQADHDSLTGLMNRWTFEDKISRMFSSKRTAEFPLSLVYLDLDNFRQINDEAGHAAGDELLRQIGSQLKNRIRDTDTLARMGGDEFAIALTACPPDMAKNIAQSIRDTIGSYLFQWEGKPYPITASIGMVNIPHQHSTMDECMSAADAACTQAKQQGPGSIVVHS